MPNGQSSAFVKLRSSEDAHSSRVQDSINQTLQPVAQALLKTPIMGAKPPPWLYPNLLNGWTVNGLVANVSYHKDALGYVHCQGGCVNTTGATFTGGAVASAIMQFPVGYRPIHMQRFPVRMSGNLINFISIDTTNQCVAIPVVDVTNGSSVDFNFTFLAEQ